ncbi:unnamed protein product, partial [Prorocentrum cordatum]
PSGSPSRRARRASAAQAARGASAGMAGARGGAEESGSSEEDSGEERPMKLACVAKRTVSMAVAFAMKRKKELMRAWDDDGAMIVVLEVADAKGLAQLRAAAKKHGLATQVVEDEGRTEVEGGAWTVLAIGPHDSARVDAVTGSLALYGGPRASSERPAAAEEGELSRLRAELAEA